MVAILPILVGKDDPAKLSEYLRMCSHKEAVAWINDRVEETIHKKKRRLNAKISNVTKTCHATKKGGRPYEMAHSA